MIVFVASRLMLSIFPLWHSPSSERSNQIQFEDFALVQLMLDSRLERGEGRFFLVSPRSPLMHATIFMALCERWWFGSSCTRNKVSIKGFSSPSPTLLRILASRINFGTSVYLWLILVHFFYFWCMRRKLLCGHGRLSVDYFVQQTATSETKSWKHLGC